MVAISPLHGEERPRSRASASRPVGRRRAILAAATALFAEKGFAGVSVQEIADSAGTHKTTVLYHFETKDALHEAVLDEALGRVAEVQREFLAGEFVRERVAYLIDQMHAFYAEHPALARLLLREMLERDGSEAYIERFVDPIYVPAVASMRRAMDAGRIRPIDPALFIYDTHVTLISYFCNEPLLRRLTPDVDPYAVASLIARRDLLVDRIFRQLSPVERSPAASERKRTTATSKRGRRDAALAPSARSDHEDAATRATKRGRITAATRRPSLAHRAEEIHDDDDR